MNKFDNDLFSLKNFRPKKTTLNPHERVAQIRDKVELFGILKSNQDTFYSIKRFIKKNDHPIKLCINEYEKEIKSLSYSKKPSTEWPRLFEARNLLQIKTIIKIIEIDASFFKDYNYTFNYSSAYTSITDLYKDKVQDFILESEEIYFRLWLYETLRAYTLESMYKLLEKKSIIKAFSHYRIGWNKNEFTLDDSFKITINTNFGYGLSSYFSIVLYYQNIPLITGNYVIYYLYVLSKEQVNYTLLFELNEDSWNVSFRSLTTIIKRTIKMKSTQFLREHYIESLNRWIQGLDNIVEQEEFDIFGSLNHLNTFIARSNAHLIEHETFDDSNMKIPKPTTFRPKTRFDLLEHRNIRVLLSLQQIYNLQKLEKALIIDGYSTKIMGFKIIMYRQNTEYLAEIRKKLADCEDQFNTLIVEIDLEHSKIKHSLISTLYQYLQNYKQFLADVKLTTSRYYGTNLSKRIYVEGWDSLLNKKTGMYDKQSQIDIPFHDDEWDKLYQFSLTFKLALNTFPELFEILNVHETQHMDRNFPSQDKNSHSSLDVDEKEAKQYKLSLRTSNETKEILNLFSEDDIKEVFYLFSNYIQDIFFYEFSNLQYFKGFNRKTFEKLNSFISKNYPKLLKTDVKIIPQLFDFYLEHSFHENKFNQDCTEIYNKLAATYLTLTERKKILYESIEKIRSEIVYLQRWNKEYDRFI